MKNKDIHCPICTGLSQYWLSSPDYHYYNQNSYDVYKCIKCRHIFQFPIPDDETISSFYPDDYYAYQQPKKIIETNGIRLLKYFLKRKLGYENLPVTENAIYSYLIMLRLGNHIYQYPKFVKNGSLLDYGCGSGQFVAMAKYLGWESMGIDFSEKAVDAGKKAGLNLIQGNLETLKKYKNKFDCITCFQTINHVPNSYELFQALYNSLKPKGILIVTDGSADSLAMKIYDDISYYLTMPVHLNVFSTKSISFLAKRVGFKKISIKTYSYRLSQAKSMALLMKKKFGRNIGRGYSDLEKNEILLGKFFSYPSYILSLLQGKGDCILAQFQK